MSADEHTAGPFIVRHTHTHAPGGRLHHITHSNLHDLDDEPVKYGASDVIHRLISKIEDGHTVEVKIIDHGRTTVAGRARRLWLLKPTNRYRREGAHGRHRAVPCREVSVPRPPWTHEPEIRA